MPSAHHALSWVIAAVGVIAAFYCWGYVRPYLGPGTN